MIIVQIFSAAKNIQRIEKMSQNFLCKIFWGKLACLASKCDAKSNNVKDTNDKLCSDYYEEVVVPQRSRQELRRSALKQNLRRS